MTSGDCFSTAGQIVLASGDFQGVRLVHGLPIYQRPNTPDTGKRYWHAWVECVADGVPWVLDFSNGHRFSLPKADYYERGQIELVFRYRIHQTQRLVTKHGHWGPWVPDPEGLNIATLDDDQRGRIDDVG